MSTSGSGKRGKKTKRKPPVKGGSKRWQKAAKVLRERNEEARAKAVEPVLEVDLGSLTTSKATRRLRRAKRRLAITTKKEATESRRVERGAARTGRVFRRRKSPLASVKPFKASGLGVGGEKPEQRQYLEPDELKRFFDVMPKTSFWYAYFYIQYMYGCRISEVALIRDEDAFFKKRQIRIRRLKRMHEKEGFREVIYAANAAVLECVRIAQRWKVQKKIPSPATPNGPGVRFEKDAKGEVIAKASKSAEGNPFLFATDRRRAATSLGTERLAKLRTSDGWQAVSRMSTHRMFRQVAMAAGLPKNLQDSHVLRHSRAIMLLVAGMSKEKVNELLGHSSMKMTERYIVIADSIRARFGAETFE